MAKYLIKYESGIATGGQSVNYRLTILNVVCFGLVKRHKIINIELNQFHSFKDTFENWDRLIKDKVIL